MVKHPKRPLQPAEIVREYGPFPGVDSVHGVTHDGERVWFATGGTLSALDPATGQVVRSVPAEAHAGTAFDGQHLWQLSGDQIQKLDPATGAVLASLPAPAKGADSGLAWAEGTLWVGDYRARRIHQIDAATGAVLKVIQSDRFVTGVSWTDGELWHATWEQEQSELRQVDPATGDVLQRLLLPGGTAVSGLESDGAGLFFCGGGSSGRLRAVRRPSTRR